MSDKEKHVDVTPEQALAAARRVLHSALDIGEATISAEQARALHVDLYDARAALGGVRGALTVANRRIAVLSAESDKLVAQIVAEEQRAVRAERELAIAKERISLLESAAGGRGEEAIRILRGFLDVNHTKHWRGQARKFFDIP